MGYFLEKLVIITIIISRDIYYDRVWKEKKNLLIISRKLVVRNNYNNKSVGKGMYYTLLQETAFPLPISLLHSRTLAGIGKTALNLWRIRA